MYDVSSKFNVFYRSYVVLPQSEQSELFKKKDLNIQRLKDGLEEYNSEHKTDYKVVDTCVQGSVAMSTVVQNEDSDYDIDVAVIFDKADLRDKGAQATRNIVANALKRKTKQFNAEPEVKTSCVRIKYADGYHIDFAIYQRYYDECKDDWVYEHAGSDWTERELTGLTDWFKTQNDEADGKLRKVVRLSKMFCKSRESWKNMPSGLLQTVLCDEKLQTSYERLDELFYYTMQEVVDRLENNTIPVKKVKEIRDVLGIKVSDNLVNAENILIVEGEDDKIALERILPSMSEKARKALQNGTLLIDYIGGAGNLPYKLSFYRNLQCKYHVLLDNDDAGRQAGAEAEEQGLLEMRNTTYTVCNGSPNAEIEDCYEKEVYAGIISDKYGVDINVPEFRNNHKWSDRIADCFKSQGKQWNSTVEKKVKLAVANSLPITADRALNQYKRSSIDALVAALERLL